MFLFSSLFDTGRLTSATIIAVNGNFTSCKDKMDFWQLWEIMKSKNNLSWNQKKRKHLYLEKHSAGFHYTPSLYLLQRLAKRQKLIGLCTRSKEASVSLINSYFLLGCMSTSDQSCSKLLGVCPADIFWEHSSSYFSFSVAPCSLALLPF